MSASRRIIERVRQANLVDVPAVVRLFTSRAAGATPPMAHTPEDARAVLRLLLAHHALEEGKVWVAERDSKQLLAAAVWLPPGAQRAVDRFHELITRELDIAPDLVALGRADGEALALTEHGRRDWTLTVASHNADPELLGRLLCPGLKEVERRRCTVMALATSVFEVEQLETLGFQETRTALLPSGGEVWLTRWPRS
ncbi:hypothetical protein ACIPSE_44400 [Streptomyces sp. NPDC090106]|uniref:hypothetical protein n=1 Tax=Streptomyces sp. NPDC090106 TaxID=3365946 RepID=UPI003808D9D5